jgi:hypothetical protein
MALESFLKECKEKSEAATQAPWLRSSVHQYDQTITYINNDSDEVVIETTSGIKSKDCYFIMFSRNNWTKLVRMVEVLENAVRVVNYDYGTMAETNMVRIAHSALEEAERIASE